METSQDDYTEETNIIQTNPENQILKYNNNIAFIDQSTRPYKIEFVQVKEKIIQDNLDNFDIDLDTITETSIDNLISTEKESKMNDEDLINFLINNDYQDNNPSTSQEEENTIKLTLNKHMEQYLEKKVKKLETIQERINEEKTRDLSFTPMINRIGKTKMRTFEEFIKLQKEHVKKVYEKVLQLKQKNIQHENELNPNKPRIDAKSEKLAAKTFQSLTDCNDVYGRLYNKRSQSPSMRELVNKTANTSMISKCQLTKEQEVYYDNLYQDAQKRKEKAKIKEEQLKQEFILNQPKSNLSSNKMLFDKFNTYFKNQINTFLNNNLSVKGLISKHQLNTLLLQLNFILNNNKNNNYTNTTSEMNSNTTEESKLVDNLFESLINANVSKDSISIEHLYIFCLSIIGLLDYYILSAYEGNNISFVSNTSSIQNQSLLLNKIDEDLNSKIKRHKQYGGFDEENNYIITINQGRTIFRDFKSMFFNWKTYLNTTLCKNRKYSKDNVISIPPSSSLLKATTTHKLKHNKSMNALYTDPNKDDGLFTHIQQSLLRKKEMEKIIQQRNSDKISQEMENCTFKPKINKHSFYNDNIVSIDSMKESSHDLLYKQGTLMQLVKSERNKLDVYNDNDRSECTFKPVINQGTTRYVPPPKIQTEENEKYNERMRRGRIEREYKNGALNLRSGFSNNNNKEFRNNQMQKTFSNKRIENNDIKLQFTNSNYNESQQTLSEQVNQNYLNKAKTQQSRMSNDSKQQQSPMLAIDIKLKDGIKKQIYVYEGNTPDQLARQFSEENSNYIYN